MAVPPILLCNVSVQVISESIPVRLEGFGKNLHVRSFSQCCRQRNIRSEDPVNILLEFCRSCGTEENTGFTVFEIILKQRPCNSTVRSVVRTAYIHCIGKGRNCFLRIPFSAGKISRYGIVGICCNYKTADTQTAGFCQQTGGDITEIAGRN